MNIYTFTRNRSLAATVVLLTVIIAGLLMPEQFSLCGLADASWISDVLKEGKLPPAGSNPFVIRTTPTIKYSKVLVHNKCNHPIWVAVRYFEPDLTPSDSSKLAYVRGWVTEGWWEVKPGQTKHIANTQHDHVYIYAEDHFGDKWQGTHRFELHGNIFKFMRFDVGYNEDKTCNLRCRPH
jgi:hypothetical protein